MWYGKIFFFIFISFLFLVGCAEWDDGKGDNVVPTTSSTPSPTTPTPTPTINTGVVGGDCLHAQEFPQGTVWTRYTWDRDVDGDGPRRDGTCSLYGYYGFGLEQETMSQAWLPGHNPGVPNMNVIDVRCLGQGGVRVAQLPCEVEWCVSDQYFDAHNWDYPSHSAHRTCLCGTSGWGPP